LEAVCERGARIAIFFALVDDCFQCLGLVSRSNTNVASGGRISGRRAVLAERLLSRNRIPAFLNDVAGDVESAVALAERRDRFLAPRFAGSEIDEKHLIVVVLDDPVEFVFENRFFGCGQVALEDRILQVQAVALAGLEDPAQSFRVPDVVGDDVILHCGAWVRDTGFEKRDTGRGIRDAGRSAA